MTEETPLTVRDQFAMAAMQGLLAGRDTASVLDYSTTAERAYSMADRMLEVRARPGAEPARAYVPVPRPMRKPHE